MDVDPREVDGHRGPAGPIQLGQRRRPWVRPGSLVPALTEHHCRPTGRQPVGDGIQHLFPAPVAVQVETDLEQAGLHAVHVRVDEGRGDEAPLQVESASRSRRPSERVLSRPDGDDPPVADEHGGGVGSAGRDEATGVQEQWHYAWEISGRFSYAVDSTVVVCVEHLASARIRASSDSRADMVGTWTLSR